MRVACIAWRKAARVTSACSVRRRGATRLLTEIGDIAATQLEPRLYAPVGLRLGGEGPEAIALAIVAQLQHYLTHDAHYD